MELANAMDDELNKGGLWAPVTPGKRNSNSIDNGVDSILGAAEILQFSQNSLAMASEKESYGPDFVFGKFERDRDFGGLHECKIGGISGKIKVDGGSKSVKENAECVFGMDSTPPFTRPGMRSSKRGNNGIRLDNKPSKRPKMKRHRPKIWDESKILKTPKPKSEIEPLTPVPKTPRRKIPKSNKRQKCTKKVSGKPDACTDGPATNRTRGRVVKQCKKAIHFDLENDTINQKDIVESVRFKEDDPYETNFDSVVQKPKIQDRGIDIKLSGSDSFGETSRQAANSNLEHPVNSCKESPTFAFSSSDFNERKIARRRKSSSKFSCMLDFDLNLERQDFEDCSEFKKIVHEYRIGSLRVYQRIFKPNECLKNSKKLGPNCPSVCKKTRMQRRKASIFSGFWNASTLENCQRYRTGETLDFGYSRTVKKSTKQLCQQLTQKVATERNKGRKGKRKKLMKKDSKSFECVFNFWLTWGRKRKRSKQLNQKQKVASSVVCFDMANRSKNIILHPYFVGQSQDLLPFVKSATDRYIAFAKMVDLLFSTIHPFTSQSEHSLAKDPLVDLSLSSNHPFMNQPESSLAKGSLVGTQGFHGEDIYHYQRKSMNKIQYQENLPLQSIGMHRVRKRVRPLTNEALLELAIECLKRLRISEDCNELVVRDNKISGKLVRHKRRKPPAKIDFDKRTPIALKQLMENDGSAREMDKDAEKYWEEERKVFRERILFFISRMHLVQGDRRFSEWKGSVLDSLVGAYLTQNVNDQLSSSSFISIAARFPPKDIDDDCEENIIACSQESTGSNTEELGLAENNKEQFQACPPEQDMSYQFVEIEESPLRFKEDTELGLVEDDAIVKDRHICSTEKVELGSTEGEVTVKGSHIFSTGQVDLSSTQDEVMVEDAVQSLREASLNQNLTNISVSCLIDQSTSYREHLQLEEADFLKQFYGHQEGKMSRMTSVFAQTALSSKVHEVEVGELNSVGKPTDNKGKKKSKNHQDGDRKSSRSKFTKRGNKGKAQPETPSDWDELRRNYSDCRPRNNTHDSVNWEAVRKAPAEQLAKIIEARGMHNILAGRIKDFLDRMVKDHGSLDLEWVRNVPPDKAKDYLLSILGLGLKSVECVRLLTLHHVAFPVDTNVGRIVVRLGWVPLKPLPQDVQIHLLDQYPPVDAIQKYLWPRLCTLDQQTLYELHYQLITFGKVFCTKRNPNCNACPMRGQCKHFASAFASAKLRLPGAQAKTTSMPETPVPTFQDPAIQRSPNLLQISDGDFLEVKCQSCTCEPIVEVPPSPEPMTSETPIRDIEDFCYESAEEEIPTIRLNAEEFRENLMDFVGKTSSLNSGTDISKALVSLSPEAASIPVPKLMALHRLRTVHQVYEIPDNHPVLAQFKKRDRDDPSPYLIRIWTPEELKNSSTRSRKTRMSNTQNASTCSGISVEEQDEQTVKGTILIPCRTANRGAFPLNGTYFQVNEVFADHQSSRHPISVPRELIWRLRRRSLYCGKTATSIFKGMSLEEIQFAFWRGFVCVRGVDRVSRRSRPLSPKFHPRNKVKQDEDDD